MDIDDDEFDAIDERNRRHGTYFGWTLVIGIVAALLLMAVNSQVVVDFLAYAPR
jgi:hypothetical protein